MLVFLMIKESEYYVEIIEIISSCHMSDKNIFIGMKIFYLS